MRLLGVVLCVLAVLSHVVAKKPRHVILMVIDDLGFADVGYKAATYPNVSYGFPMPTPTINKWAMNGVRLEHYYVQQLCSPTRTALLSGRYAYTIGQDATVITDGRPLELNLNISTMADHLQKAGWATSAYGKWDAGMTSWGCTPQCRGFDYFAGYFNADEDYFTHMVGTGLDLRDGWGPDLAHNNESGVYSTELFTTRVQDWITRTVTADPTQSTFAYVAHQAIHGPTEVTERYLEGECMDNIPAGNPTRRMVCGQMKAVDESLANITATYEKLGILEETVVFFTTDNGGNQNTGGNNWPLRGAKATTWEGGVRGVGWASGAGLDAVAGTVSSQMMHVSDWYPTIVEGIAGLPLKPNPGTPPFDGMDMWDSLTTGGPSPRTEMLLELRPVKGSSDTKIPGQGAIRVGKWKLLHGTVAVWGANKGGQMCASRNIYGGAQTSKTYPLPVTDATAPPFCPYGWVPPVSSGKPPVPPPDAPASCTPGVPCNLTGTDYQVGGTWLFDLEADPTESNDVSAANPDIVAQLMAKLQAYNASAIPQMNAPDDPLSNPKKFGGVWTPWRGDPVPQHCSKDVASVTYKSSLDKNIVEDGSGQLAGWVWSMDVDSGLAPLRVTASLDGSEVGSMLANITRPKLNSTGAPNNEHGFLFPLPESVLSGKHELTAVVAINDKTYPITGSPLCVKDGKPC